MQKKRMARRPARVHTGVDPKTSKDLKSAGQWTGDRQLDLAEYAENKKKKKILQKPRTTTRKKNDKGRAAPDRSGAAYLKKLVTG